MISRPFEDVIHELCTQILSEPAPETLPERIIGHVLDTFPVEWATLWVTEQKSLSRDKQLRLKAAAGPAMRLMKAEPQGTPAVYDFGQGLTGYIADAQKAVNITRWEDFSNFPHEKKYDALMYGSSGARGQCRAVLGVPLRLKSSSDAASAEQGWRVIGVLKLENLKPGHRVEGHFTDEDLRIVEAYAAVVAVALEKAQMREDSVRIGNGLLTISAGLLRSLGAPPDLHAIVRETAQVISAQACALWRREGMELRLSAAHGYPNDKATPQPYLLSIEDIPDAPPLGLTVFVAKRKRLLNLRTMTEVKSHAAWRGANDMTMWGVERGTACYSLLAIPLVDEETGQLRGVFKIENKRPTIFQLDSFFNDEDEKLLAALGNSINSSMASADRFDRLQRLERVAGQICYPDGEEPALFLLLTALTHGMGLGYNRALVFLSDGEERPDHLTCRFAVGPLTMQDWDDAVRSTETTLNLRHLLDEFERDKDPFVNTPIMQKWKGCRVSLADVARQKIAHHAKIELGSEKYLSESLAREDIFSEFALGDFALTAFREGTRLRGIIYCDNRFTGNTINKFEVQILEVFAGIAGAILDAAALPAKLRAGAETAWQQFSQPAAHRLGTETNIIDGTIVEDCLPALSELRGKLEQDLRPVQELGNAFEVIRRSAGRLRSAAKDYRQLTPTPAEPELFDLRMLIRESIHSVKIEGLDASLVELDHPVLLVARRQRLGYVIEELLLNAWKESPAARRQPGPPIRVRISLAENSTGVEIIIVDNGPGIPDRLHRKLFLEPQTGRHGGTGLGLVIIRRNLKNEGGDISLWPQCRTPDFPGASFRITLPLVRMDRQGLQP